MGHTESVLSLALSPAGDLLFRAPTTKPYGCGAPPTGTACGCSKGTAAACGRWPSRLMAACFTAPLPTTLFGCGAPAWKHGLLLAVAAGKHHPNGDPRPASPRRHRCEGRRCAARCLQAWATRHWVCLRTMHGRHEDTTWPACLALSADGALLASGSTGPLGASTIKVGAGALVAGLTPETGLSA